MAKDIRLKSIDLNLLVVFEAVFSAGNISRASEKLGSTQSAVSHSLARLRDRLDDKLFVRKGYGVEPTLKARQIIEPVRKALGLIGGEVGHAEALDLANYRRTFKVIMIEPLEPVLIPPLVQRIFEDAPGVSIEASSHRPGILDDLLAGTLDIACTTYHFSHPDIVVEPLERVDMVVVARRGNPHISKGLSLEAFSALGHIAFLPEFRAVVNVDRDLIAQRAERRIVYACSRTSSFIPIIARSDLIGIMSRRVARDLATRYDVQLHPVPVPMADQFAHLMWHTRNQDDPGHKWMREIMMEAMRSAVARGDLPDAPPPSPEAVPRKTRAAARKAKAAPARKRSGKAAKKNKK